jgi:putative ABC transport system substrate-binding protein
MNNRRKLVIALCSGAVAAAFGALAQTPARSIRIGFLGAGSASSAAVWVDALRAGLRDLGYVEGRNLNIDFRWADGDYDRFPGLIAELVQLKIDVLVTHGTPGTLAAKRATTAVPIVMAVSGDPIGTGVVTSLAHPGGNITGSTFFDTEISAKRLELLKEISPSIKRVAVLLNANNTVNAPMLQAMEVTAKSLKLELQTFGVRGPAEFENAFSGMSKRRVNAVTIQQEVLFSANAKALADLAIKHKLPSIGFAGLADAGGLIAYGVNFPALFRRAAVFVDKIVKGTNPGDLPIERATTFDFHVNRKTAQTLGLKIPNSILVRADRVIE